MKTLQHVLVALTVICIASNIYASNGDQESIFVEGYVPFPPDIPYPSLYDDELATIIMVHFVLNTLRLYPQDKYFFYLLGTTTAFHDSVFRILGVPKANYTTLHWKNLYSLIQCKNPVNNILRCGLPTKNLKAREPVLVRHMYYGHTMGDLAKIILSYFTNLIPEGHRIHFRMTIGDQIQYYDMQTDYEKTGFGHLINHSQTHVLPRFAEEVIVPFVEEFELNHQFFTRHFFNVGDYCTRGINFFPQNNPDSNAHLLDILTENILSKQWGINSLNWQSILYSRSVEDWQLEFKDLVEQWKKNNSFWEKLGNFFRR